MKWSRGSIMLFSIKWSRSSTTSNITKGPNILFSHNWMRWVQRRNVSRHSYSTYNSYCLVRHDWCNVGECRFKLQIRARKTKTLLAFGHNGNNQIFSLLVGTTENSTSVGITLALMRMSMGELRSLLKCSMGCYALCPSPLLIHDIYKKKLAWIINKHLKL